MIFMTAKIPVSYVIPRISIVIPLHKIPLIFSRNKPPRFPNNQYNTPVRRKIPHSKPHPTPRPPNPPLHTNLSKPKHARRTALKTRDLTPIKLKAERIVKGVYDHEDCFACAEGARPVCWDVLGGGEGAKG